MTISFVNKLHLGSIFLILAGSLIGILFFHTIQDQQDESHWARDKNEQIQQLLVLENVLDDAELAHRAFLTTQNQSLLLAYSTAQEQAKEILKPFRYSATELSTVLLIQDHALYSQSTAVLKIFRRMPGPWPLMYGFIIVPRPLRDFVYGLIAKNRYRIFGRKDVCRIPTPELQSKFVG